MCSPIRVHCHEFLSSHKRNCPHSLPGKLKCFSSVVRPVYGLASTRPVLRESMRPRSGRIPAVVLHRPNLQTSLRISFGSKLVYCVDDLLQITKDLRDFKTMIIMFSMTLLSSNVKYCSYSGLVNYVDFFNSSTAIYTSRFQFCVDLIFI